MKTMVTTSQSALIKGWQSVPLSTVVEPVKDHWKPGDTRLPYIGLEHIAEQSLTLNGIGDSDSVQSNKFRFTNGDVLFGKLRPYFRKVVQVSFDGICSTDILVLRAREGYDQKFLFYFVANPLFINRATKANTGTRMPRADWGYLQATKWLVPSLPEQKAIAAALSSLDDKIELLRRQNETLEKLAQTLFKEWFVEFNFPDKNGKPYKASGGKMVDSELGPIPAGWKVGILGDEFKVAIGRTPPRKEHEWFSTVPTDVRWMSVKDLGECQVFIDKTTEFLTRDAIARFNIPVIPPDTVVLSFKLTVGRVAITTSEMLSNEAIAQFQLRNGGLITPEYLYLFLKSFDYSSLGSTSSIATAVNSESIRGIPAVIPDQPTTARANDLLVPTFSKLRANVGQIGTLVQLRDTLLPKLMSGHIRIGEYT